MSYPVDPYSSYVNPWELPHVDLLPACSLELTTTHNWADDLLIVPPTGLIRCTPIISELYAQLSAITTSHGPPSSNFSLPSLNQPGTNLVEPFKLYSCTTKRTASLSSNHRAIKSSTFSYGPKKEAKRKYLIAQRVDPQGSKYPDSRYIGPKVRK